MRRERIEQLGSGFNSHVFQHPELPDMAVKVVDAGDKVYLKFARWAMKNKHNPFVPKIHSIVMIDVINHHPYALVFLEKLDEVTTTEYEAFLDEMHCGADITTDDVVNARDSVQNDDLRTLLTFLCTRISSLDLHEANFMKRGQQIVFIDPFAGG